MVGEKVKVGGLIIRFVGLDGSGFVPREELLQKSAGCFDGLGFSCCLLLVACCLLREA